MLNEKFGTLTVIPGKKQSKSEEIANELDIIFKNTNLYRTKFSTMESDRVIAMRRLDELTNTLKVRNLRYKSKSFCDYFVL